MKAWILTGEKSHHLKDIDKFVDRFKKYSIDMEKINVSSIDIINTDDKDLISVNGQFVNVPPLIISAYFGNIDFKSLMATKILENKNTLIFNSSYCIETARNKLKTYIIADNLNCGILSPKTMVLTENSSQQFIENNFSYPLILKINSGSKGDGVEIAENYNYLIKKANALKEKYNDEILIQEYISSSKGVDIRVIVCGGKYITSFRRENSKSFKSNLADGGSIRFASPDEKIIKAAEKIASALDMNLGSVDFLLGENGNYYLCEANAMPGNSYSEAAKAQSIKDPFDDVIKNIIEQIKNTTV